MLESPSGQNTLAFTDIIEIWTWLVVVLVSILGLGRISTTLIVGGVPEKKVESGSNAPHSQHSQPTDAPATPRRFFTVPRAAVPTVLCLVAMHWLLLWRVLRRRRWACLFSSLYGWLFYQPYWGHAGWLSVLVAALLLVIAASVVVGWRDMTDGW